MSLGTADSKALAPRETKMSNPFDTEFLRRFRAMNSHWSLEVKVDRQTVTFDNQFMTWPINALMKSAGQLTHRQIVHKRKLQTILERNYGCPLYLLPNQPPSVREGVDYYCLRDVVRHLPKRPRCHACGKRFYHWQRQRIVWVDKEEAAWWVAGSPYLPTNHSELLENPACSDQCWQHLFSQDYERSRERKQQRRKDLRCLNIGRKKLREIRKWLNPAVS
jgi:hypothetical protein